MQYNPFVRYTVVNREGQSSEQGINLNHLIQWKFGYVLKTDVQEKRPCLYVEFVKGNPIYIWDDPAIQINNLLQSLSGSGMGSTKNDEY